ncbi:hypothetical protein ACH5RR_030674 [Cinchona calisaya]|uniref:Uncharacterized protein n=1 Tax=Cinchona calisaya TaxID=153742 RepID=A0ABD2YVD5_9GENT
MERPPVPAVGRRNVAAAAAGIGSIVVCVGCGDGFKGKIVENSEEMKNWKCFKAPGGLLASVYHLTRIEYGVDQPGEHLELATPSKVLLKDHQFLMKWM